MSLSTKGFCNATTRLVRFFCLAFIFLCVRKPSLAQNLGQPQTMIDDNCQFRVIDSNGKLGERIYYCGLSEYKTNDIPRLTKTLVTIFLGDLPASYVNKCFSWHATLFSSVSPFVTLYAAEDLAAVPHTTEIFSQDGPFTTTGDRCSGIANIQFTFSGSVRWIRLFAQPPKEGAAAVLPDTYTPSSNALNRKGSEAIYRGVTKYLQQVTEAPGATNIQIGWSPSFNGPQKLGVYSNIQYLTNLPDVDMWLGVSSLVDTDNRGQQNPDAIINTVTYIASWHGRKGGDITDFGSGWKVRPALIYLKSGAEYAPFSGVLNQISSASLQVPIAVREVGGQESPITFSPIFGIEAGGNLYNSASVPTSTAILRPFLGSDASYRFRIIPLAWILGTKPYTLNGSFRARFPTTEEVYTTSSSNGFVQTPDKRIRIYGRAELSIPFSRLLAASIVYQYGDLPPAFSFFGHTVSIAFKASSPIDSER